MQNVTALFMFMTKKERNGIFEANIFTLLAFLVKKFYVLVWGEVYKI